FAIDVREIEVNHWFTFYTQPILVNYFVNRARGHVAGHEIAVLGIPLFEEVPALVLGNRLGIAIVAGLLGNPDTSTLATRRLGHQAKLVFARNRRGMNLDELSIRVVATLLVERRLRRSGANHGVGGFAEDRTDSARADDDCGSWESADLHGTQVHGANAAADVPRVNHWGKKFPTFVLLYFAFRLVTPNLLSQRIEKLLTCSRAGECGTVVKCSTEAAKVEQSFRSAIEGDTHAVKQVDDSRRRIAHGFHRRLIGQEVTPVDCVVKMLPGGVALSLEILCGVNAALRAHRVRALDCNNREQIDLSAHFGDLNGGGKSCQ